MNREPFLEVVREALDSLPWKFRRHIENFAVVVEDYPPEGYHTKGGWRSLSLRRFRVAHRFALFAKGWGCFSQAEFALYHSLAQPSPRF